MLQLLLLCLTLYRNFLGLKIPLTLTSIVRYVHPVKKGHNQIENSHTYEVFKRGCNGHFNYMYHFLMKWVWLDYESKC